MSIAKIPYVFCDRCNMRQSLGEPRGWFQGPREVASQWGWIRRKGQDICPACQDEEYVREAERETK